MTGVKIMSGGSAAPKPAGSSPTLSPVRPIRSTPARRSSAVFDEIWISYYRRTASEILDWSDARLPEVSDYFDDGAEWWGVFLFSVHIPSMRRLTIIAGSTTD